MYLDKCPLAPRCDYEVRIYHYLNIGDPAPPYWHEDGVLLKLMDLQDHMREVHGARTPAERVGGV